MDSPCVGHCSQTIFSWHLSLHIYFILTYILCYSRRLLLMSIKNVCTLYQPFNLMDGKLYLHLNSVHIVGKRKQPARYIHVCCLDNLDSPRVDARIDVLFSRCTLANEVRISTKRSYPTLRKRHPTSLKIHAGTLRFNSGHHPIEQSTIYFTPRQQWAACISSILSGKITLQRGGKK